MVEKNDNNLILLQHLYVAAIWNEQNGTMRPLDEPVLKRIKVHWATLTELITLGGDLIDKLYTKNCITNIQRHLIEASEDDAKKNSRLLEIMSRKSVADFNYFVSCLQDTQQGHVAVFLLIQDAGKLSVIKSLELQTICSFNARFWFCIQFQDKK